MPEQIRDGGGNGVLAKVAADGRLHTEASTEIISANRSREGKLFGLGTGFLTIPQAIGANSPILWFQNRSADEDWYIQKIIAGHRGSESNPTHNVAISTLIKYDSEVPTANNTEIFATIENISKSTINTDSGDTTGTRKNDFLGYKWNESGTAGMTAGSGGFYQIPNSWAQGNTTAPIDGEIIIGPGKSMQFDVIGTNLAASDTMEFHISVVFWVQVAGKERAEV